MGNVAKDGSATSPDLPGQARISAAPSGDGEPTFSLVPGPLTPGLPVREVLRVPALQGATVLAGEAGLDRVVARLNVMEVPDILDWVKPDELILTTGYPLRATPEALPDLVEQLHARGVVALAIKPGRYLDELPPDLLAVADRLGFPLIQLPAGVGFDDILNQALAAVLNQQAAVLVRSEEVHRALVHIVLTGGALEEVAAELAKQLDAAVYVTTTDGRVLAEAGPAQLREKAAAASCFEASGRLRVEHERHGITSHGGLDGEHALVRVVAGRLDHGRIVAFAPTRQLSEPDIHALERAATVAALAITKQLAVAAVESKYRGDFLRDLLSGGAGLPDAEAEVVAHCASLGWDVNRRMVALVAELDPDEGPDQPTGFQLRPVQERFAQAWATVLRPRDPLAPLAGFNREVVVLLGVPDDGKVDRLVRDLVRAVSGDGGGGRRSFSTGVSRVIDGPAGIPAAYAQAHKAVRVGRQVHGRGAVAHFDELGVHRLLSLIPDAEELRGFVAETLRELASREDDEAADLRRTLEVLLECNLNVAEAARVLHFHYNTLRYRIGKLERILGPFTTDARLRLDLSLALQVLRMRGL